MIFVVKSTLFIGEFKFSDCKINQSLNGINCIFYKQYSERSINFLKRKRLLVENVEEKITEIVEFSIASEEKKREISFAAKRIAKMNLNLKSYKTIKFVQEIRKNRKHFINIMKKK